MQEIPGRNLHQFRLDRSRLQILTILKFKKGESFFEGGDIWACPAENAYLYAYIPGRLKIYAANG